MPDAKFVLKEPSSKHPTLVYLFLRFNSYKLKYSTGQKIHPKFWNEEKQRAKETKNFPGYEGFNSLLKNMGEIAEAHYRTLLNNGEEPTPEKIREYLNEKFYKNAITTSGKITFFDFIEKLIQTSNKSKATIKQYKLTYSNLYEYATCSSQKIDFDSIDVSFYDDFMRFLLNKNYSTNTLGARIKNLKVFMNEAVESGLTNNIQFRNKRFKKPQEKSESIYLTIDEVNHIYNLDLSNIERLDKVRDLFIIGCYTGLRFSDLIQLRDENLIDNKTKLKVKTQKTGEFVVIPLHRYIKQILEKYNGIPPRLISNQKMNEYLKELGQLAAINDEVMISTTRGGNKHCETFYKYQLITVHTARRSFATNAYLNDIPTISIMKITGHNTEKAFLTYIKISQEENANKLLNHPFFNAA